MFAESLKTHRADTVESAAELDRAQPCDVRPGQVDQVFPANVDSAAEATASYRTEKSPPHQDLVAIFGKYFLLSVMMHLLKQ